MNYGPVQGHLEDEEILGPEIGIKDKETIAPQAMAEANKN